MAWPPGDDGGEPLLAVGQVDPRPHPGPRPPRGARVEVEPAEDAVEDLQQRGRRLPRLVSVEAFPEWV